MMYGYHPSSPLDVGVCPHPTADVFLHDLQSVLQTQRRYHAFAQQRLMADHISAIVRTAKEHIMTARNRQKQHADRRRTAVKLVKGDQVMLQTKHLNLLGWPSRYSRKLFPLWMGPFVK